MAQLTITFDFPDNLLKESAHLSIVSAIYSGDFCPYVINTSRDFEVLKTIAYLAYLRLPGAEYERL